MLFSAEKTVTNPPFAAAEVERRQPALFDGGAEVEGQRLAGRELPGGERCGEQQQGVQQFFHGLILKTGEPG